MHGFVLKGDSNFYSHENFIRNLEDLQNRMDLLNQRLAEKTNFQPTPRLNPFSNPSSNVQDPARLFDQLYQPNSLQDSASNQITTDQSIENALAKDPNNPNLPIYQVYPLRISYGTDFPGLPDLNELRKIKFRSSLHGGVIDLGGLMKENVNAKPYRLSTDDLREIAQICVHYLKENGLEGMVAMVSPSQIDPSSGADLEEWGSMVWI